MKKILLLIALAFSTATIHSQVISTIAGNGTLGYSGDGGPATLAEFGSPVQGSIDAAGNMYFADIFNSVIRKVDVSGNMSTIVGYYPGHRGYSGDGGPATAAELDITTGVSFDASGNMYVADNENNVIRIVNALGVINRSAGTGGFGYSGDGGQASAARLAYPSVARFDSKGNMYIADYYNNVIRKVNPAGFISTVVGDTISGGYNKGGYSGDGGLATAAELKLPQDIAFDSSGNMYIADYWNNVVRKVDTSGIITTVIGNGYNAGTGNGGYSGDGGLATAAELYGPTGLAFDALWNLYIADAHNNVIRKVNTSGIISTIAGNHIRGYSGDGGPSVSAELNQPEGVFFDTKGNLFISDEDNNVVRMVSWLPAGIAEHSISNSIQVFPNPSNGEFTVTNQSLMIKSTIDIYNILGEKIYSTDVNSVNTQIDISGNPYGVYLYRVIAVEGNLIGTGKLIID
jgi:hypothetical protein